MPVDLTGKSAPGNLSREDFLGPVGKAYPYVPPVPYKDPSEIREPNAPSAEEMAFKQVLKVMQDAADLFTNQAKIDSEYVNRVVSAYDMSRERTKEAQQRDVPLLKDAATNEAFRDSMETEFKNLVGEIDPLLELGRKGIKPGSIYTHDIYLLKAINHLVALTAAQNKYMKIDTMRSRDHHGNVVNVNIDEAIDEMERDLGRVISQDRNSRRYFGSADLGEGAGGGHGGGGHGGYGNDPAGLGYMGRGYHGFHETFRELYRDDPIRAIVTKTEPISNYYTPEFNPVGQFGEQAKERDMMRITMRQLAYETEGITGDLEKQQKLFYNIDQLNDSITTTGKRRSVIEQAYVSNLRMGFKSQKDTLKVTKAGLNLSTMIGANAEATSAAFGEWHMQLGLSGEQLAGISAGIQATARDTNVTGDALMRSVQNAKPLLDLMRNAGTLTAGAANNMIRLQTEADKLGMGTQLQPFFAAMANGNTLLKHSSDEVRHTILYAAQGAGLVDEAMNGTLARSPKAMKAMAAEYRKMLAMFTDNQLNLETMDLSELTPDQLANANRFAQHNTGLELGEFINMIKSVDTASMNYEDTMKRISNELMSQNLTLEERKKLMAEQQSAGEQTRTTLLTQMTEKMKKGDFNSSIGSLNADASFREILQGYRRGGGLGPGGDSMSTRDALQKILIDQTAATNKKLEDNGIAEDDKFIQKDYESKIKTAFASNDNTKIRELYSSLIDAQQAAGVREKAEIDPITKAQNDLLHVNDRIEKTVGKISEQITMLIGEVGIVGAAIVTGVGAFFLRYVRPFSTQVLQPAMRRVGLMPGPVIGPSARRAARASARTTGNAGSRAASGVASTAGVTRGTSTRGLAGRGARPTGIFASMRSGVRELTRSSPFARFILGDRRALPRKIRGDAVVARRAYNRLSRAERLVTPRPIVPPRTGIGRAVQSATGSIVGAVKGTARVIGSGIARAGNMLIAESVVDAKRVQSAVQMASRGTRAVGRVARRVVAPPARLAGRAVGGTVRGVRSMVSAVVGGVRSGFSRTSAAIAGYTKPFRDMLRSRTSSVTSRPLRDRVAGAGRFILDRGRRARDVAYSVGGGIRSRLAPVARTATRPFTFAGNVIAATRRSVRALTTPILRAMSPTSAGRTARGFVRAPLSFVGNALTRGASTVRGVASRATAAVAGADYRGMASRFIDSNPITRGAAKLNNYLAGIESRINAKAGNTMIGRFVKNFPYKDLLRQPVATLNKTFRQVGRVLTPVYTRAMNMAGVQAVKNFPYRQFMKTPVAILSDTMRKTGDYVQKQLIGFARRSGVRDIAGRRGFGAGAGRVVRMRMALGAAARGVRNRVVYRLGRSNIGRRVLGGVRRTRSFAGRAASGLARFSRRGLGVGRSVIGRVGSAIAGSRAARLGAATFGRAGIARAGARALGGVAARLGGRVAATGTGKAVGALLGGPVGVALTVFTAAMEGVGNAMRTGAQAADIFRTKEEARTGVVHKVTMMEKMAAEGAGFLVGGLNSLTFGLLGLLAGEERMNNWTKSIAGFLNEWPLLGVALQAIIVPLKAVYGILWGLWEFISGAFVGAWKGFLAIWEPLKAALSDLGTVFMDAISPLTNALESVFGKGSGDWVQDIINFGKTAGAFLGEIFHGFGILIGEGLKIATPAIKFFVQLFGVTLKGVIEGIVPIVMGVIDVFKGVWNFLGGLLTLDFSMMGDGLAKLWSGLWGVFGGIELLPALLNKAILGGLGSIFSKVGAWFDKTGKKMGGFWGFISRIFGFVMTTVGVIFSKIADSMNGLWTILDGIAHFDWRKILSGINQLFGSVFSTIYEYFSEKGISGVLADIGGIGVKIGTMIKDGLVAAVTSFVTWVKDAFVSLGGYIGRMLYKATGGLAGSVSAEEKMSIAVENATTAMEKAKAGGGDVAAVRQAGLDALNYEHKGEADFVKFNAKDYEAGNAAYQKVVSSGGKVEDAQRAMATELNRIETEKRTFMSETDTVLNKAKNDLVSKGLVTESEGEARRISQRTAIQAKLEADSLIPETVATKRRLDKEAAAAAKPPVTPAPATTPATPSPVAMMPTAPATPTPVATVPPTPVTPAPVSTTRPAIPATPTPATAAAPIAPVTPVPPAPTPSAPVVTPPAPVAAIPAMPTPATPTTAVPVTVRPPVPTTPAVVTPTRVPPVPNKVMVDLGAFRDNKALVSKVGEEYVIRYEANAIKTQFGKDAMERFSEDKAREALQLASGDDKAEIRGMTASGAGVIGPDGRFVKEFRVPVTGINRQVDFATLTERSVAARAKAETGATTVASAPVPPVTPMPPITATGTIQAANINAPAVTTINAGNVTLPNVPTVNAGPVTPLPAVQRQPGITTETMRRVQETYTKEIAKLETKTNKTAPDIAREEKMRTALKNSKETYGDLTIPGSVLKDPTPGVTPNVPNPVKLETPEEVLASKPKGKVTSPTTMPAVPLTPTARVPATNRFTSLNDDPKVIRAVEGDYASTVKMMESNPGRFQPQQLEKARETLRKYREEHQAVFGSPTVTTPALPNSSPAMPPAVAPPGNVAAPKVDRKVDVPESRPVVGPTTAIPMPRGSMVAGISPVDNFVSLHDEDGIRTVNNNTPKTEIVTTPLTDLHTQMQQEYAGLAPANININNDALDRTADASDKQVVLITELIGEVKRLSDAMRPTNRTGGGNARAGSTRSNIQPPNSPNYADWAFGVFGEVANRGIINDGSTT